MYVFKYRSNEGPEQFLSKIVVDPDDWATSEEPALTYECFVLEDDAYLEDLLSSIIVFHDRVDAYNFFQAMAHLGLNPYAFDIVSVEF